MALEMDLPAELGERAGQIQEKSPTQRPFGQLSPTVQ